MTTMFQEHPDGLVYVRTPAATYGDTKANFEADSGLTLTPLPAGARERIYQPGVRHAISGPDGVIDGGPMPWSFGDIAIANVNTFIAAQASRQAEGE